MYSVHFVQMQGGGRGRGRLNCIHLCRTFTVMKKNPLNVEMLSPSTPEMSVHYIGAASTVTVESKS